MEVKIKFKMWIKTGKIKNLNLKYVKKNYAL